ncbi:hypothetical protein [Streptomyces sp. NPDC093600]|uniref:hypothetical protein n=1 Tax=Streptomyces sp. NPDC093600 TaxID=3366047 RepID=UPI003806B087
MNEEGDEALPNRSKRARQVLERFGQIVWFRSPTERHPFQGNLQVAFLGWRFAHPHDELKAVFEAAARSAPQKTEWTFRSGKNWMILPVRLIEESGPGTQDFNEAMVSISKNDQGFCADTAADLESILGALARAADSPLERAAEEED